MLDALLYPLHAAADAIVSSKISISLGKLRHLIMRLTTFLSQSLFEISLKIYKRILALSLILSFLLAGCSQSHNYSPIDTVYLSRDHQTKAGMNISREKMPTLREYNYTAYSQSISNFLSSPEMNNITSFLKPYIDELVIYIPQIESAGIILKDIYTDLNPVSPLLILEFKLDAVDEKKLDSIVSRSIENKQKLSAGLKLLRSAVQASKLKIGQFYIERVQIRMGPYPPFASTRIQYSRG
jgi:hypothetical protein